MRNFFFLLIGIIFIVGSIYLFLQKPVPAHIRLPRTSDVRMGSIGHIAFGTRDLLVEISDTDAERERGLSGRSTLGPDHGMLFVFEKPSKPGFWMKDMMFDLDIVWINSKWEVVSIDRGVKASSYPQIFSPSEPILYVLEVSAGIAESMGLDIGSKLSLNP